MAYTYNVPKTAPVIQDIDEEDLPRIGEDGYQNLDNNYTQEEDVNLDNKTQEEEESQETQETPEEENEETADETSDNQTESEEEESEEESTESQTEDDPFADYSEAAIYAAELQRTGFFDDEYEINKEATHHDVLKDMMKIAEEKAIANAKAELLRKGYTEEHFKRQDYLASGGDPSALSEVGVFQQLASVKPQSYEEKKQVIAAMYQYRGLDTEEAQELIQKAEDLGKLDSKVKESQDMFTGLYNEAVERIKPQEPDPEEIKRIEQERIRNIQKIIDKGEIGPFNPDEKGRKQLYDFVTDQKYVTVYRDEQGNESNHFVTGFQKAWADLQGDLDKQMVIAYLLMNDFNLAEVKSKVKEETVNSALDYLNRNNKKKTKKSSRKINPYYRE